MKLKSAATKKSFDRTKVVRNLANNFKLVPHIERALAKGEFDWQYEFTKKEQDDAWHPSSHCTPSVAQLYEIATTEPEERQLPSSLVKTFQVGHFWHQYLQWVVLHKLEFCDAAAVERIGVNCWGPTEALPYHWVKGAGDIAPCTVPVHGDYIVDFKTMGDHDYKQVGVPEWCATKYECQINIYMDLFDLERGLIVAIQKGSPHDMKEFEYRRNQPLIDAIYEKWHIVSDALDIDETPEAEIDLPLPVIGPAV